jgi:very-short-patch-repair endonuclease
MASPPGEDRRKAIPHAGGDQKPTETEGGATRKVIVLGLRHEIPVSGSRDERITAIAEAQRGYVSRRQLLAAGVASNAIDRAVAAGRLCPRHRGVYRVGPEIQAPLAAETAALLAVGRAAVLSHHSAATLWGLQRAGDGLVHVFVAGGPAGRFAGVRVHRTQPLVADDLRVLNRLPVTSPARTIIDLVPDLTDRQLEFTVDQAITERVVRTSELTRALQRLTHAAGRSRLLDLLDAETHASVTESDREDRLLALIRRARLPEPLVNTRVAGYRVDFYWPRQHLVVEVDGYQFHSSQLRFERDRKKDAALHLAGIATLRFSAREVVADGLAVLVTIAQAIARADADAA